MTCAFAIASDHIACTMVAPRAETESQGSAPWPPSSCRLTDLAARHPLDQPPTRTSRVVAISTARRTRTKVGGAGAPAFRSRLSIRLSRAPLWIANQVVDRVHLKVPIAYRGRYSACACAPRRPSGSRRLRPPLGRHARPRRPRRHGGVVVPVGSHLEREGGRACLRSLQGDLLNAPVSARQEQGVALA
jgi:hypothetical protein